MEYHEFLKTKQLQHGYCGFDVDEGDLNPMLFDWQKVLVKWALKKGRAALFEDCGLGKTPQQLEWADQIVKRHGGKILILTPLAVSTQTIREGAKFGIEVRRSQNGKPSGPITVTNYERLSCFSPDDFVGVVCDESSILKNFDGVRRREITEFLKRVPFALLCTATAAPNDYIELGTSAEAIGAMGYMDMLNRFFKNDQNNSSTKRSWSTRGVGSPKWRFKKHAENHFWRWVCSWAMAIRKPSDIGYDDDGFILPPIKENEILVEVSKPRPGRLFVEPAGSLKEQRQERRATLPDRCETVADIVNNNKTAVVWCHLNDEGDLLQKLIPDASQVKGSMDDERKEAVLEDFTNGNIRVLIIKPKIGAFGLNWQHCHHMTFFPSHSYEQYYQGVRRCWRFGQKKPVQVDIVTTPGDAAVLRNLKRKSKAADRMFTKLVNFMNDSRAIRIGDNHKQQEVIPSWLS